MHRDFAPAQKTPICPACDRNMKVARPAVEQGLEVGLITFQQGLEVGLITFECGPCRVSYTTAAEEPGPKKMS